MSQVVFLAGSPQVNSRSTRIAGVVAEKLEGARVPVRQFGLTDFAASDLVLARTDNRAVQTYLEQIQLASAVVFSTPVYKATYTGGLKLLVDIIPPEALRGKAVLAVVSARSSRHFQSAQRGFEDLYRFFDVGLVIPSVFVLDEQIQLTDDGLRCDDSTAGAL